MRTFEFWFSFRIAEQGLEEQKKKALDSERLASDYKAQLEKCSGQLADAQSVGSILLFTFIFDIYKLQFFSFFTLKALDS